MDLDLIRTTTLEYLDGTDTSRHFAMLESRWPWDRAYGTESYPYLVQYLHEYAEGRRLDIRPSHVLWEHKKLSVLRMRRAADLRPAVGELVERAQQLESDAYVLRNAMIRDDILGRRPDFLPKALARLDTIQKTEHQLLTDFAAALT
jgi:hypothetical protein